MFLQINILREGLSTLIARIWVSLECTFKCCFKLLFTEKALGHLLQGHVFSHECILKCFFQWLLPEKALGHLLQEYEFSPECTLKCCLKLLFIAVLKLLSSTATTWSMSIMSTILRWFGDVYLIIDWVLLKKLQTQSHGWSAKKMAVTHTHTQTDRFHRYIVVRYNLNMTFHICIWVHVNWDCRCYPKL